MDKEKIMNALQQKMLDAMIPSAAKVISLSTKWTPIYNGDLRRDKLVRSKMENSSVLVEVVQSPVGSRSHDYAKRQYFDSLRHAGSPNDLQPLPSQEISRNNPRGNGDKTLYSRRYRAARKYGSIRKMPAPEWFSKVINSPAELSQILEVFRNRFKSRSVKTNG